MYLSSAPARVCLFGEHQDYLFQKVIPAAINLRLNIVSEKNKDKNLKITSINLNETIIIPPNIEELSSPVGSFKAFIEAGVISLKQAFTDIEIPAINSTISSYIPLASGLSSSAALLVGWISHLSGILEMGLDKRDIAELAYNAEHRVMNIPCGKMDQYSTSYGSIISLSCIEPPELTKLRKHDFELVIVNSNTPKLTSEVHGSKVHDVKRVVNKLERLANTELKHLSSEDFVKYDKQFPSREICMLKAILSIKEDTEKAETLLQSAKPDIQMLGELLSSQQNALRDGIKVSLPILDKIVKTGIEEGALGGKLTGAGLGGCVVFLVREDGLGIMERLKSKLELPTWFVEIDQGVYFEKNYFSLSQ
ncbi:MAG: hypothetical protein KGD64_08370 [Candidatus Heimdallarchaeota archaeon]|nr:hypothetical protein [Candidatus Heimdallarchaeota archaeon]